MNTKRIVITGGPSTGKTAVIKVLQEKGYHCLDEVIRAMTSAKQKEEDTVTFKSNPIVSVKNPMVFNQMILDARLQQYQSTIDLTDQLVFFDRGIPDVLGYMDCFEQTYDDSFKQACIANRYDFIFLMPPWKEIHVPDKQRFESFEESLRVHECLSNTYSSFGYAIQLVPKDTISNRIDFIIDHIKELQ